MWLAPLCDLKRHCQAGAPAVSPSTPLGLSFPPPPQAATSSHVRPGTGISYEEYIQGERSYPGGEYPSLNKIGNRKLKKHSSVETIRKVHHLWCTRILPAHLKI